MSNVKKNEKIDKYNSYFPKLLRQLMDEKNVTQEELAEETGVTRQTIAQYKDGNTTPDIETFVKIVEYFRKEKRN